MTKRRPFPWRPFNGRFDPTRKNPATPNLSLGGPAKSETEIDRWVRLAQWSIERQTHLGAVTWSSPAEELNRRLRASIRWHAWIFEGSNARRIFARWLAAAEGELDADRDPRTEP